MSILTFHELAEATTWMGELEAGSRLELRGSATGVLTEPMRWLDGVLITPRTPLAAGHVHRVAHGGWVQLHVQRGGTLVCHAPVATALRRQAWQALRRVLAGGAVATAHKPVAQR